jgi:hypothetical protein
MMWQKSQVYSNNQMRMLMYLSKDFSILPCELCRSLLVWYGEPYLELPWCSKSKTLKLFHGDTPLSGDTLITQCSLIIELWDPTKDFPMPLSQKQREPINICKRAPEHQGAGNSLGLKHNSEATEP